MHIQEEEKNVCALEKGTSVRRVSMFSVGKPGSHIVSKEKNGEESICLKRRGWGFGGGGGVGVGGGGEVVVVVFSAGIVLPLDLCSFFCWGGGVVCFLCGLFRWWLVWVGGFGAGPVRWGGVVFEGFWWGVRPGKSQVFVGVFFVGGGEGGLFEGGRK